MKKYLISGFIGAAIICTIGASLINSKFLAITVLGNSSSTELVTVTNFNAPADFTSYTIGVRTNDGLFIDRIGDTGTRFPCVTHNSSGWTFVDALRGSSSVWTINSFNGAAQFDSLTSGLNGGQFTASGQAVFNSGVQIAANQNLFFGANAMQLIAGNDSSLSISGTGLMTIQSDTLLLANNASNINNGFVTTDASGYLKVHVLAYTNATLNFGSTAAGAVTTLTTPLIGVTTNSVWDIKVDPQASVMASITNGLFKAWVSSADTITVTFVNPRLVTAEDPASGQYLIIATQYQ